MLPSHSSSSLPYQPLATDPYPNHFFSTAMELEQLLFGETINSSPKMDRSRVKTYETTASSISSSSKEFDELSHASDSFNMIDMSVPKTLSTEKKLAWLRSQIVVGEGEFNSPYGLRRLTYADHTASGRALHYIENYLVNYVLPFYGKLEREAKNVMHEQ